MEISAHSLNSLAQTAQANERSVAVLKKALESQQQLALGLIQALPQPSAKAHLPAHLGQNINTTA